MLHVKDDGMDIWLAAYICFQCNLIAHVVETVKWHAPDLLPFYNCPDFRVAWKLCWAKKCNKERDTPTQVLFGTMDWRCCALSLVSITAETTPILQTCSLMLGDLVTQT